MIVRRETRVWTVSDIRPISPDSQLYRPGREFHGQKEDTGKKKRLCHCHYALSARRHGHMKVMCDVYAFSIPRYAIMPFLFSTLVPCNLQLN